MSAVIKRPAFQFYPGDWLNDAGLRMVSIGARGLWIDMLCLMHQGSDYGHLKVNSKAISSSQLARMVGGTQGEVDVWLAELLDAGVYSVDKEGCIFSRRMIRDEAMRQARADGGKLGGNPKLMGGYNKPGFVYAMRRSGDGLIKVGISQSPSKRAYKIRAQYPGQDIDVIGQKWVEDMGAAEAEIHRAFAHAKEGEWFDLTVGEVSVLLDVHLKAKSKVTITPSSSSSSSSSSSVEKKKAPEPIPAPPEWVNADDWQAYAEMRKRLRKPMTAAAARLVFRELTRIRDSGLDPDEALRNSVMNGWTGVFPPKQANNGAPHGNPQREKFNPYAAIRRAEQAAIAREMGDAVTAPDDGHLRPQVPFLVSR